LTNESNRLGDLERHEEALAAIAQAVDIRWGLAAARPDAFLPDLGSITAAYRNAPWHGGPSGCSRIEHQRLWPGAGGNRVS
jgi:hypothetical protein